MFLYFLVALARTIDPQEEVELLNRIILKDEKALKKLYSLYSRIIYSIVLRIVRRQEDAEEILQNVFLQVWDKAASFQERKGSVYTWLLTMARNRAIDRIRSKGYKNNSETITFENEIIGESGKYSDSVITALVAGERMEKVREALKQLSADQREVIELIYFEGFTQSEIAARINIPIGTVKTRSRQAMLKLHGLLSEYLLHDINY